MEDTRALIEALRNPTYSAVVSPQDAFTLAATVIETLFARAEKAERERDEARREAERIKDACMSLNRDKNTFFEQSCKNLTRADAALAEVARLREALEKARKAIDAASQTLDAYQAVGAPHSFVGGISLAKVRTTLVEGEEWANAALSARQGG